MRFFKGKPLELLAPAGNFEIFKAVVETKCDAIYFGGQSLNMRMIRKGFNFTNDEIVQAINIAHEKDKRVYITVNNLIDADEIEVARDYLKFLELAGPDGIIVQDFAIIQLIKEMKLNIEVHSSVMMNVHNVPMIETLKEHKVTRVVLSREATLDDVRWIKSQTDMEIEYFTHGDMCIAHGAQCYYSSMLFGMSSNRGKCLKPCRWWFSDKPIDIDLDASVAENNNDADEKSFPMAVKDLCLYQNLPEMIYAGVTSFKLEGRMREADFITKLINFYGDAMDRFIADPVGYDRTKDLPIIEETRKRDLSTGYAFGKPGITNINTRFEGTGKFYSTGKMFSTPTPEKPITDIQIHQIKEKLQQTESEKNVSKSDIPFSKPKLSIRVNNIDQALLAIEEGVDRIYLSGDIFLPAPMINIQQIKALKEKSNHTHTEIYVGTPRMMNEMQLELYYEWFKMLSPTIDGILIGNLGALRHFSGLGLPIVGDYSLNIFNSLSADFYKSQGLSQFVPSVELTAKNLKDMLSSHHEIELNVHGRLTAMYYEHDFHSAYHKSSDDKLTFFNEAGSYDLFKDHHGRSHLLTEKAVSLLPILNEVLSYTSLKMLRFEAQSLDLETLKSDLNLIKMVLESSMKGERYLFDTTQLSNMTFGALAF